MAATRRGATRRVASGYIYERRLIFLYSTVWGASQLFRRQRDASLAHLTLDEIAMHPRGHALLEAP